jgi:hypothetical protein
MDTNKPVCEEEKSDGSTSDETSSETEFDSKKPAQSVNIDLIKSKLKSKDKEPKIEDSSVPKTKKDTELSENYLKK